MVTFEKRSGRPAVALLLGAGIESISELGLARTTVSEVCARAGVPQGALFRHFGDMQDFVVAVAEETAFRQIVDFQRRFDAAPRDAEPFETALRLLWESAKEPANAVFTELRLAARTDLDLRERLMPMLEAYGRDIEAIAVQLPGLEIIPPEYFEELLLMVLDIFAGSTGRTAVRDLADLEESRIPLMIALLRSFLA
ncbi:MAG: helix-turn-helix domain-containing protein [Streptosporangiaceae bacterium]